MTAVGRAAVLVSVLGAVSVLGCGAPLPADYGIYLRNGARFVGVERFAFKYRDGAGDAMPRAGAATTMIYTTTGAADISAGFPDSSNLPAVQASSRQPQILVYLSRSQSGIVTVVRVHGSPLVPYFSAWRTSDEVSPGPGRASAVNKYFLHFGSDKPPMIMEELLSEWDRQLGEEAAEEQLAGRSVPGVRNPADRVDGGFYKEVWAAQECDTVPVRVRKLSGRPGAVQVEPVHELEDGAYALTVANLETDSRLLAVFHVGSVAELSRRHQSDLGRIRAAMLTRGLDWDPRLDVGAGSDGTRLVLVHVGRHDEYARLGVR
jgi:hypothetical protein